MKRCSKCGELLPKNAFSKDNGANDGLYYWCKKCVSLHDKKRLKDPIVREKRRIAEAKWRAKNPEKEREIGKRYRAKNLEKRRQRTREYQARNPEKIQVKNANDRAKELGIEGILTEKEWIELRNNCNGVCPCCGRVADLRIDHINPFSKGGPNLIRNIQPLCFLCNKRKFTKTIRYIPCTQPSLL